MLCIWFPLDTGVLTLDFVKTLCEAGGENYGRRITSEQNATDKKLASFIFTPTPSRTASVAIMAPGRTKALVEGRTRPQFSTYGLILGMVAIN